MPWTKIGRTVALAAAAAVLAGCFSLSRTSPRVESFVLGGVPAAPVSGATNREETPGISIGLRRLDLATYLATLAIVVRHADNEIIASGFHRWAESPNAGVNRAIAGYLAAAPAVRSVDVAPWPARTAYDFLVQVHVTRFEGVATGAVPTRVGEAHLQARWEILRPPDDRLVARGSTDVRSRDWPLEDYADLVSRLDQGLARLSDEIVACIAIVAASPGHTTTADATSHPPPIECPRR
jgi:uncharacterized protein